VFSHPRMRLMLSCSVGLVLGAVQLPEEATTLEVVEVSCQSSHFEMSAACFPPAPIPLCE